jgi:hypothetical protein
MTWNGSFQKRSTLPPQRKFLLSGGGGETKLFLIIVNVLGRPKGVGGLTSNFLRGGGMDVIWNDPMPSALACFTPPPPPPHEMRSWLRCWLYQTNNIYILGSSVRPVLSISYKVFVQNLSYNFNLVVCELWVKSQAELQQPNNRHQTFWIS